MSRRRPPWLLPPTVRWTVLAGLPFVVSSCVVERTLGEEEAAGDVTCSECTLPVRALDLSGLTTALEARVAAGADNDGPVPTSLEGINSIRGLAELPSGDVLVVGVLSEGVEGETWGFLARVTPSGQLVYEGIVDAALTAVESGPDGDVVVGWNLDEGVVLRSYDHEAWTGPANQAFAGARFDDVVWDGRGGYFVAGSLVDGSDPEALALHYDGSDVAQAVDVSPDGGSVEALFGVDVFLDGAAMFVGRWRDTSGDVFPWAAVARVGDDAIWSANVRGDRDPPGELRDVTIIPGGHGVTFGVTQSDRPNQMSLVAEAKHKTGWVTAGDADTGSGFTAAARGDNGHAFGFEMIQREGVDALFEVRVRERWLADFGEQTALDRTYFLDVDDVFVEAAVGLSDGRLLFGGYETRPDGSTRPWLGVLQLSDAVGL